MTTNAAPRKAAILILDIYWFLRRPGNAVRRYWLASVKIALALTVLLKPPLHCTRCINFAVQIIKAVLKKRIECNWLRDAQQPFT